MFWESWVVKISKPCPSSRVLMMSMCQVKFSMCLEARTLCWNGAQDGSSWVLLRTLTTSLNFRFFVHETYG